MKWFVRKVGSKQASQVKHGASRFWQGESVKMKKPKTLGFYYGTPATTGWTKTVDSGVFACDDDVAPLYKTSDMSWGGGGWDTGADLGLAVKQIVKLNIDLSSIPTEEMIVPGKNGPVAHYVVGFDVEMTLDSAKLSFSMFYKGKGHRTVHAEFD